MKASLSRLAFLTGLTVAAGCSTASTASSHSIYVPSAQFRSVSSAPASRKPSQHAKRGAATLVEESLHARGIRFGTDGSVPALFAFMREQFAQVQADQAHGGDVLFFDLGTGCGAHVGLVETAEPGGRIGFREWRDGNSRHSYVTPHDPYLRRDTRGRIMNTFLRPKRIEDPAETTYFAGEMLCAAFRVD